MKLWWDLETYSETPITDGSHRYAEGSEILLFPWAIDDGPEMVWDATHEEMPVELRKAISEADEYWGHNSGMFDRTVLKHCKNPIPIVMKEEKHRDTMVQALCHGLPGKLETLCEIFKLEEDQAKDKRGKQLIQMFCKPQAKNSKIRRKTKETHPREWQEFIEYAKSDIRSMRILHNKMPKWNYPNHEFELKLWQLDQQINQRGLFIDMELVEKSIEAVNAAQKGLSEEIIEITEGEVSSANQRDKLIAFVLKEHGMVLPDMKSATLERLLDMDSIPEGVKELIRIRLAASTSSVSKYKKIAKCISSDGYLRGTIQFSGAGRTGRDAGRLFQPQNLMRPTLSESDISEGVEAIKAGCAELVTDNVMELCANTMRGVIIAPPNHKLVIADLSNIEGRVLAWLAKEEWKLNAFRDFDNGIGEDLYKVAYGKAFKIDPKDVTKDQRQIGKTLELAMGYQGGVGAFVTFAAAFRLDLESLPNESIPNDVRAESENFYNWSVEQNRPTFGLSKKAFMTCDSLKRLWRIAHPATCNLWSSVENAAIQAVCGEESSVNGLIFKKEGKWLKIILPSGRALSYPLPSVEKGKLVFSGVNQYTRKWSRISTYGGKTVENIDQAVSRDVFKSCYPSVMAAGYYIRLPIHDELITYAPDTISYNASSLSALMTTNTEWAKGLPLAAAGFECYRYRKG